MCKVRMIQIKIAQNISPSSNLQQGQYRKFKNCGVVVIFIVICCWIYCQWAKDTRVLQVSEQFPLTKNCLPQPTNRLSIKKHMVSKIVLKSMTFLNLMKLCNGSSHTLLEEQLVIFDKVKMSAPCTHTMSQAQMSTSTSRYVFQRSSCVCVPRKDKNGMTALFGIGKTEEPQM